MIVRDAEAVRVALVPADASGGGRWSLLGQSFGGFCAVSPRRPAGQVLAGMPFGQEQRAHDSSAEHGQPTSCGHSWLPMPAGARLVQVSYLSTAPEALSEVLLTGGLPPGLTQPCSAEAAYMSLYRCSLVSGRSRCSWPNLSFSESGVCTAEAL